MLQVESTGEKAKTYPLTGEMIIGREKSDIPLVGEHTSRRHAKIIVSKTEVTLQDLDSANGTYVNGKKIKKASIEPGDELRFDTETFVLIGPGKKVEVPVVDNETTNTIRRPKVDDKKDVPPAEEKEIEKELESEPGEVGSAWYERATPNLTAKITAEELPQQFAKDGTQIVRGIEKIEMPSLVGTSGSWAGKVITLYQDSMTIGRSSGADIILDDPCVSAPHGKIEREGDLWRVIDLMSANGIYVNGEKTLASYLSEGDALRFGQLEFRFVIDSTDVASLANPVQESVITGSDQSTDGSTWIYLAAGFVLVLAIGAFLLFGR